MPDARTKPLRRFALPLLALVALAGAASAVPQDPPASQPETPPTSRPSTVPDMPSVPALPTREQQFVEQIKRTHNAEAWARKRAVRTYLYFTYQGQPIIDGTLTVDLHTDQARLDQSDGTTLVWDGETAWVSPPDATLDRPRFQIRAWPYFLTFPFRLEDPGTRLEMVGMQTLNMKMCETARLSFEGGVGDTPDDWFFVSADPVTHRLAGIVYIMTYGRSVEEANGDPFALVYSGYTTVEGIKMSTNWTTYRWTANVGTYGAPLGRARLSHIEFITPEDGFFDRPPNSREDTLPGHATHSDH